MNLQRFFLSCIGFELLYNCSCIRNLSLTKQIENKKMWLRLGYYPKTSLKNSVFV